MSNSIYYKGKSYGETKPIIVNKHQIIVGDGDQWATAAPFQAKLLEYQFMNLLPKSTFITEENCYRPTLKIISNTEDEIVINSIKVKDLTDDTEEDFLTQENFDQCDSSSSGYYIYFNIDERDGVKYVCDRIWSSSNRDYILEPVYSIKFENNSLTLGQYLTENKSISRQITFFPTLNPLHNYEFIIKSNNFISLSTSFEIGYATLAEGEQNLSYSTNATTYYTDNYLGTNTKEDSLFIGLDPKGEFGEKGYIKLKDKSETTLSENSKLIIDGTSECFIHNDSFFVMDNTGNNVGQYGWDGKRNWNGNFSCVGHDGPMLFLHDKSSIVASHGSSLKLSGKASICAEGEGFLRVGGAIQKYNSEVQQYQYINLKPKVFFETGEFIIGGDPEETQTNIPSDISPIVHISAGTFYMQREDDSTGDPFFALNGGSTIIMNGNRDSRDPLYSRPDPLLMMSQSSFIYVGQGSKGVQEEGYGKGYNPNLVLNGQFDTPENFFKESSNRNTRINIAGDTQFLIGDGDDHTGKNWIQFSANSDKQVYFQVTNNPFFEINHDSVFQMKGYEGSSSWLNDNITSRGDGNGPMFKMHGKPLIFFKNNAALEASSDYFGNAIMKISSTSDKSINGSIPGKYRAPFVFKTILNNIQTLSGASQATYGSYSANFNIIAPYTETLSITSIIITDKTTNTSEELITVQNLNNILNNETNNSSKLQTGSSKIQTSSSGNKYIYNNLELCSVDISTDTPRITLGTVERQSYETARKIIIHYTFNTEHDYDIKIVSDNTTTNLNVEIINVDSNSNKKSIPIISSNGEPTISFNTSSIPGMSAQRFIGIDSFQGESLVIGTDSNLGCYDSSSAYISLSQGSHVTLNSAASVFLTRGSNIIMENNGRINLLNGGYVSCDMGSGLNLNNNSQINMSNSSQINILNGSQIGMSNNSYIILSNGYNIKGTLEENGELSAITFGGTTEENSVTFTIAELKQLKLLLNS